MAYTVDTAVYASLEEQETVNIFYDDPVPRPCGLAFPSTSTLKERTASFGVSDKHDAVCSQ